MTKSKIKTIIMVVAMILVVALAAGWIAQSVITKQKKEPSKTEQTVSDETEKGESADMNNGLIITPATTNKLMRLTAAPLSDSGTSNSCKLTATIQPSNTSDQSVAWSAAWKNPFSSWASGKTVSNYLTVMPSTDNSLSATATCLEAFGEQIVITVTTKDGTNLTAECVCDYVKRVTKTNLTVPKSSVSDDLGFDTSTGSGPYYVKLYPSYASTAPVNMKTTPIYGVGTVEDELTTVISYSLSSNYYSVLSSKGYTVLSSDYVTVNNASAFVNNTSGCQTLFGSNFFSNVNYANAVIASLGTAGNCMVFTVTTTGKYSQCTNTYQAFVNTSAMQVKATSVSLGNGNIKF